MKQYNIYLFTTKENTLPNSIELNHNAITNTPEVIFSLGTKKFVLHHIFLIQ